MRVAPTLRDGTESEISHTFPFPAVCTGPLLDETLRMLKPLAPTLETLGLGGNKLGGTITDDIAAFTKLTELRLFGMDLKGTFVVLTPMRVAPGQHCEL